ncbi:hypothetical protein TNCV_3952411 [Trichonephila clavipes]|uniref:Uncharacterized protein n=1 Tax=Trichonephila clavipes TaxID=2585209 RepID=A0A8X6V9Y7_TRICX|nr:hypothetical protein TNCV_3952411 [Trichonephila clavipes]
MDHDENLERCKLILTEMDDDALRIAGRPFFKITGDSLILGDDARKNRMYHDEIPERCKLNFTGIVDDALRIAGELFPKQTLKKNTLKRKLKLTPTDGPTSFSEENTSMPYSGFVPEPTELLAESHIHHSGWAETKADAARKRLNKKI